MLVSLGLGVVAPRLGFTWGLITVLLQNGSERPHGPPPPSNAIAGLRQETLVGGPVTLPPSGTGAWVTPPPPLATRGGVPFLQPHPPFTWAEQRTTKLWIRGETADGNPASHVSPFSLYSYVLLLFISRQICHDFRPPWVPCNRGGGG